MEQVVNVIFTLSLSAYLLRYSLEAACAGGTFATTIAAVFASGFLMFLIGKKERTGL